MKPSGYAFLLTILACSIAAPVAGFSSPPQRASNKIIATTRLSLSSSSLPTSITHQEQTLDNYLPPSHPLHTLITATTAACAPRQLDTTEDAHEAFRYEWGTWCSTEKLDAVMETLDSVRLVTGAYEELLSGNVDTS